METALTQGTALAVSCEGDKHDAHMASLLVSPLASGASVDDFAARVNTALVHHIPFLTRPYPTDGSLGRWVIKQLPPDVPWLRMQIMNGLSPTELQNSSAL